MKFSIATLLALFATAVSAEVPSLTPENYAELTDGKTVFLKFFAPWCGHCKKMAPDWEKLASDWETHEIGFVGEVDCTAEGKPLCDAEGVRGFPTLKYGDPAGLDDYEGARTYEALSKFAKENLKPVCSPANLDLCDDEKKQQIETYMKLSNDELAGKVAEKETELEAAEQKFQDEVQKLQDAYQKLSDEKDQAIAAVKESGLKLMKAVSTFQKKQAEKKDEL